MVFDMHGSMIQTKDTFSLFAESIQFRFMRIRGLAVRRKNHQNINSMMRHVDVLQQNHQHKKEVGNKQNFQMVNYVSGSQKNIAEGFFLKFQKRIG